MVEELVLRRAGSVARRLELTGARYTLGRAAVNDLAFPDDGLLSRQHLVFESRNGGWQVTDLGSSNGTTLNGSRIDKPSVLRAGDRIVAGSLEVECCGQPSAAGAAAPEEDRFATVAIRLDDLLGAAEERKHDAPAAAIASAAQTEALIQAGRELAGHRPLAELFPLILDLAANAVGSNRGALLLLEDGALHIRASKGGQFEMSKTVRDRVLLHRESLLIQDVQLDDKLRLQASIVAQRIRSILAVPLQTGEKVIGLIYLDSPHFIRPFTPEDLGLLTVMANIAAIRIENARLTEVEHHERLLARELAQAAEIQKNLLPRSVPARPGMEIAAFSEACRSVGGDHYDFYARGNRQMLLVGDVAGKGMPAALLMSSLQARVQVLAEEEIDLAAMVTRLNRVIASNCPGNRFITFFVCEVDLATGETTYVNAGHNPPLLLRAGGTVEQLEGGGMILGIFGRAAYSLQRAHMEEGDLLVLFSDGVTEAQDPATEEDFGTERLIAALAGFREHSTAELIEQVKAAVTGFAGSVPGADDFTLILARKTAGGVQ
jgi:serine phosphatase RsbU (regulator of sigma subunit)